VQVNPEGQLESDLPLATTVPSSGEASPDEKCNKQTTSAQKKTTALTPSLIVVRECHEFICTQDYLNRP
jgi:hypothetical protein